MAIERVKRVVPAPVSDGALPVEQLSEQIEQLQQHRADSASGRERFDRVDFGGEADAPEFRAVSLIKNSEIPLPEASDLSSSDLSSYTSRSFDSLVISADASRAAVRTGYTQATVRTEQREVAEGTATASSSEEIAQESSNSRFTPAQQRGVEVYRQFQSYGNALNLSHARMAG